MSLRWRIVLLVLFSIFVPAALLGAYLVENRNTEIARAEASLNGLAARAAQDLSDKASGAIQLLHGLSRAADLDAVNRAECSLFLADVLQRFPQYTGLFTILPNGQLHCDSLVTARTLDFNDRAYFRNARESTEPALEAVFGRLTGVAVLQVAYPARDASGALRYVLLASLNLAQYSARFTAASPYPGMEMVIWDRAGAILTRYPEDGLKLAGMAPVDSALFRFVQAHDDARMTAELPGPDGNVKIWARSTLPSVAGGLGIGLGIPREVLLAKANRELYQALAILVAVSLLAFLAALLLAEISIRRQVARIARAAARQGAGDFNARIGAPYPSGELGGLMSTLDLTAASVQAQQAEIQHQSSELRRTNRTLRMLGAINSAIVRIHDRDELLHEACRIACSDGEFPAAWAMMHDPATLQLACVACEGVDMTCIGPLQRNMALPDSVVSSALRDRRPVVVNDVAGMPEVVAAMSAAAMSYRSLAALPLVVSGKGVGVLMLHAHEASFFDHAEMKLLVALAADVAFALEHIEQAEQLTYLAYYDSLTGLANRALFHDRLTQALGGVPRAECMPALVVCDVERFHAINETFGRAAGDNLLRQIAVRTGRHTGNDPRAIGRIGADHLAWIIVDEPDVDNVARRVAQLHREVFDEPFAVGGAELSVAARFGIALFPRDGEDADSLLGNAEVALKKAKGTSERFLFFDPAMTDHMAENLALDNRLRRALANGEFVLHYEPKVDVETRRITGVEAVIRWQSPDLGMVAASEFIPLMEQTGLILQVGAWAFQQAARDHRRWGSVVANPPRVAVNVSPIQLRGRDFVNDLMNAIGEGVTPVGIDLEVTESLLMGDVNDSIDKLNTLRAHGIVIAVDDFGTGRSSLAYLAKLPVQTIKIDRSFVVTMLDDSSNLTMVSTIIALAHSLRLTVVAQGVETEAQAKVLRLLGCEQLQGCLIGKPMSAHELLELLQRGSRVHAPLPAAAAIA